MMTCQDWKGKYAVLPFEYCRKGVDRIKVVKQARDRIDVFTLRNHNVAPKTWLSACSALSQASGAVAVRTRVLSPSGYLRARGVVGAALLDGMRRIR
jgi:hypothetical protein